jgi:hypothetical protein
MRGLKSRRRSVRRTASTNSAGASSAPGGGRPPGGASSTIASVGSAQAKIALDLARPESGVDAVAIASRRDRRIRDGVVDRRRQHDRATSPAHTCAASSAASRAPELAEREAPIRFDVRLDVGELCGGGRDGVAQGLPGSPSTGAAGAGV